MNLSSQATNIIPEPLCARRIVIYAIAELPSATDVSTTHITIVTYMTPLWSANIYINCPMGGRGKIVARTHRYALAPCDAIKRLPPP